jgi:hypothetical protein
LTKTKIKEEGKMTGIEIRTKIKECLTKGKNDDGNIHQYVWGKDKWDMFYVTLLELQNLKLQGIINYLGNFGYNTYFYELNKN